MLNFIVGFVAAFVLIMFVPDALERVQAVAHDAASSVADATDKPLTDKIIEKIK